MKGERILVVSNRLPFTIRRDETGYRFEPSVGGLVSGLSAYLDYLKSSAPAADPPPSGSVPGYVWVGWPGCCPEPGEAAGRVVQALAELRP
ncbi:MAG: hypothetical protein HY720_22420, partial [Planctomycetes bacterium]|nr:hypothetical protein [Planctomycetota bacterium]